METDEPIARPSNKRSLVDIWDLDKDAFVNIDAFIFREVRLVIQDRNTLRSRYKQGNPWLACSICGGAVQLVSQTNRSFYFRHQSEEEDRGCPINTKGKHPDLIDRMKYNGAKESATHKRLKHLVELSLRADQSFTTIAVEKVWRGMDRKSWRKPDVQAATALAKYAFEIQLSTTYLSVIVDRRIFYQADGGLLVWIFDHFDPYRTRRAEEDVFYNNNSNAFVVDEKTYKQSIAEGRFMLECWYAVPQIQEGEIVDLWQRQEVFFDELTFDLENQRTYYFDYEAERQRLECEIKEGPTIRLRDDFEAFWREYGGNYDKDGTEEWSRLRSRFSGIGISLPTYYSTRPFSAVISIMLSAKHGVPIGYGYEKLIEVAHVAFTSYKNYLLQFGWALNAYGRQALLDSQDHSGKWLNRKRLIREAMKIGMSEYQAFNDFDDLISFLLPEVKQLRVQPQSSR